MSAAHPRRRRASFAILVFAVSVSAAVWGVAGRHLTLIPDSDLAGRDLRVLKEVELEDCKSACLSEPRCLAFTYNAKAGWCFLKDRFEAPRTFVGAVSGRVVEGADAVASERAARLGFLSADLLASAERLVKALPSLAARDLLGLAAIRDQAQSALGQGKAERALALYAAAARLAPQEPEVWLGLARAAAASRPDDPALREQRRDQASAAAINAYLQSAEVEGRSAALVLLGDALAQRDLWPGAIAALRAALALREDQEVRARYRQWRERHGFRITNHRVELESASPRICLEFSQDLALTRPNLADFVQVEEARGLAVEAQQRQICIDGVSHGASYRVQVRSGLPAADGESLSESAQLDIRVGDRTPMARFLGRTYVLPRGPGATIPVVSVNADRLTAVVYRIGDRSVAQALGDGIFLKQLEPYQSEQIRERSGEESWRGTIEVQAQLNREVTTAIPVGELIADLRPGVYAMTAVAQRTLTPRPADGCDAGCGEAPATQWFVVSDLGLTALSGNDGLHALVRSLSSAAPAAGVALRLLARNNEILASATTDQDGYARFEPGLLRGTGGNAPLLLTALGAEGDYGLLDLTGAPFDLSDRGVTGRPAPKPLDVFLVAERGVYRPGETVHLTALVRDSRAQAVGGIPLTLAVKRPDGVELERRLVADAGLGAHQMDLGLAATAMRGTWRVQALVDPKGEPLAETRFLVEDFEPERLDFSLGTDAILLDPAAPPDLAIAARFLYGAPAGGLPVEGETLVRVADAISAHPGYRFGLAGDVPQIASQPLAQVTTDAQGMVRVVPVLPESVPTSRPLMAEVQVRIADPGGRPVERSLSLPIRDGQPRLGLRPLFEGEVEEGGEAGFEVIALDATWARAAAAGVAWTLERVETGFQWYRGSDGRYDYEPVERSTRVASGTLDVGPDRPARLAAPVQWGSYRLRLDGDGFLPVSLGFEAGWYVAPRTAETPDRIKLSLDKAQYRVGERARVHLEPRPGGMAAETPGIALVMVLDDRLIAMQAVEVPAAGATVELPVTADWGPGAYVTAALYRPMDLAAKRMPGRAIGIAWAGVDPAGRRLPVTLTPDPKPRPRSPLRVGLQVPVDPAGGPVYATLAAVDLGILNLTAHQAPAPDTWYFGQRRLGMEMRDLYGQLIDRMQGAKGVVRSGGDGGLSRLQGPPPTQELMAWFSGVVPLDAEGRAELSVPVTDFNGTVRLMAMAWSANGLGHGVADALVRDPVVVAASLPRFLAPGDSSRLLLSLTQTEGAGGPAQVQVQTEQGRLALAGDAAPRTLDLTPGRRVETAFPIEARALGDETLKVSLSTADGQTLERRLTLGVQDNTPPQRVSRFDTLAPASTLVLGVDRLAGLVPGSGRLLVSASRAGRLDLAGLLAGLDRYPHGCTEQLVSRALPLLYLDQVALAAGLAKDPQVRPRVQEAVARILGNQSADGRFGLWGPGGDDPWLDAFATDFLTRAREQGHEVPESALEAALLNLANRGSYSAPGAADAYGLYVLARNGRASIGDLRYIADERLADLGSPLARAQIGAALALYGDQVRADLVLAGAAGDLGRGAGGGWRADFGSDLRDAAAVLALAAESGTRSVDLQGLGLRVQELAAGRTQRSTQEDTWLLLAANALIGAGAGLRLEVDGARVDGAWFGSLDGERLDVAPIEIRNLSDGPVDVVATTIGVPLAAPPAGGNGYAIERAYYALGGDLDGRRVELDGRVQGQRLVAVLTVRSDGRRQARLIVDDPLPAGFEIDNPNLLRSADLAQVPGLNLLETVAHREFRSDRFVAALDRGPDDPETFQLGYLLRAVTPGDYAQPPASVEDMYDPVRRAWTSAGRVRILGPVEPAVGE